MNEVEAVKGVENEEETETKETEDTTEIKKEKERDIIIEKEAAEIETEVIEKEWTETEATETEKEKEWIEIEKEETEEIALWPVKHTVEELHHLQEVDPLTYDTQYQQDPTPKEGLMYEEFKTYNPADPPQAFLSSNQRWNYTDTADTGADFLASGCFVNTPMAAYITDIA